MFYAVEILADDVTYEVVPASWLADNEDDEEGSGVKVLLPPTSQIRRSVRKNVSPQKGWLAYDCRIKSMAICKSLQ